MAGAAVGVCPANQWFAGLLALCLCAGYVTSHTQPTLFPATWIQHPTATARDYAVFPVLVSADNRYKLYVNGQLVSLGPTRGDLLHYRCERVDLGPYLRPGPNTIAATVWNMGAHQPAAQISLETGFWLQAVDADGEPIPEHTLNTDGDWEVHHDLAYAPELNADVAERTYAVVDPTDVMDASQYPWGWRTGANTASWVLAQAGPPGKGYGAGTDGGR